MYNCYQNTASEVGRRPPPLQGFGVYHRAAPWLHVGRFSPRRIWIKCTIGSIPGGASVLTKKDVHEHWGRERFSLGTLGSTSCILKGNYPKATLDGGYCVVHRGIAQHHRKGWHFVSKCSGLSSDAPTFGDMYEHSLPVRTLFRLRTKKTSFQFGSCKPHRIVTAERMRTVVLFTVLFGVCTQTSMHFNRITNRPQHKPTTCRQQKPSDAPTSKCELRTCDRRGTSKGYYLPRGQRSAPPRANIQLPPTESFEWNCLEDWLKD